ncbi:MAG TPA: NADH:ubiquinone reductase (Na(+)-transporting) subunit B [Bacteroidales bacterium]|nr:NADH:ubiquinone reductase (Na(+)-transporting) subunit B [Bacteroidales bacterium]
MDFLNRWSKKLGRKFEKGRTLYPFRALYDAIDTFLLTPATVTEGGSHIRDAVDMKRIMITVMIALFPPLLFGLWNIGYQHFLSQGIESTLFQCFWYGFLKWLPMVLVVYVVGLTIEIIFAQKRKHEVAEGFFVTGFIIPMIMPPELPLWILAIATAFSVLFAKEVFGGTGYNFLNPALVARAFVFFSYPSVISGDTVWIAEQADAVSGATALGLLMNGSADSLPSITEMCIGTIPGSIGETSKIAIALGACILLFTQVASWRIMLSVIVGGLAMGSLFNVMGTTPAMSIPAYEQLLMGGFLFGAVYMATDPVTATHTQSGKFIYGFLIGALAIVIRVLNKGYPEGMMLSILLMNIFASLIDYVVIQQNIRRRKRRAARSLSTQNLKQ